jgi:hypothetical protein
MSEIVFFIQVVEMKVKGANFFGERKVDEK